MQYLGLCVCKKIFLKDGQELTFFSPPAAFEKGEGKEKRKIKKLCRLFHD